MNKQVQLFDLSVSNKSLLEINKGMKKIISKKDFILGEDVKKFEKRFSNFLNSQYTLGLNSGTDSLEIALRSLDIGPGDEVIVPSFSFFASSEVILKTGAQPIYCDINLEDLTLNLVHLKSIVSEKTKAVIAVHLFGNSVDLQRLKNIVSGKSIYIIEDVAQAFGSTFKDKYLGSIGEFGCFSFYPTKNLGAFGDAGAITFNKKKYLKKTSSLRNHGNVGNYFHDYVGFNSRLDSMQALIVDTKLKTIKTELKQRIKNNNKYIENIDTEIYNIHSQENQPMNVMPITTKNHKMLSKLKILLERERISYGSYYPFGLHEFPISELKQPKRSFPNTDFIKKNIITLPCHPGVTISSVNKIINLINKV